MEQQIVYIPANYTDAGKLFGMFEIRNTVEAVFFVIPVIILGIIMPFDNATFKIIMCSVFIVPTGGFALMGIHDYSLMTFIKIYVRWRRNKRILFYSRMKNLQKEVLNLEVKKCYKPN